MDIPDYRPYRVFLPEATAFYGTGASERHPEDIKAARQLLVGIAGARHLLGVTQRQVAGRMGTAQSAVSDLEKGTGDPRLSTVFRLPRALGLRLEIAIVPRDPNVARLHGALQYSNRAVPVDAVTVLPAASDPLHTPESRAEAMANFVLAS